MKHQQQLVIISFVVYQFDRQTLFSVNNRPPNDSGIMSPKTGLLNLFISSCITSLFYFRNFNLKFEMQRNRHPAGKR